MLRTTIALTALFYVSTALAQADCKAIQNPPARFPCFDAAPSSTAQEESGQVSGGNRAS